MTTGAINLRMCGRFGNNLFQYCFARAHCERYGLELRTEAWVGEEIFDIKHPRFQERFTELRNEDNVQPEESDIEIAGYFQRQDCLIYTREQVQQWLRWRPSVEVCLSRPIDRLLGHLRHGDYFGYGYPVVSRNSFFLACEKFGLEKDSLTIISEENPTPTPKWLPQFLADFWRLAHCKTLLRSNSSFSWWAAAIAKDQRVFSPVIDGLEGGKEHDAPFVEGNHPRFCNLEFVTDLFL